MSLAQLEAAPLHTPITLNEKPRRQSFQDAVEAVLADSKLKALLSSLDQSEGTEEGITPEWHTALEADIAAADNLLTRLAEDLTKITGIKVVVGHTTAFWQKAHDAAKKGYTSPILRVRALYRAWVEGVNSLMARVSKAINDSKVKKHERIERSAGSEWKVIECSVFPCVQVQIDNDACSFEFPLPTHHGEKLYKINLATFSFRPPDDYPMSIPDSAKRKLEVLKTTNFDFHPQILDGILVDKQAVLTTKREWVRYTSDPALTIHFGLNYPHFVVDYWDHTPGQHEQPPKVHNWLLACGFLAISYIFVLLWMLFSLIPYQEAPGGPGLPPWMPKLEWNWWLFAITFPLVISGIVALCWHNSERKQRSTFDSQHLVGRHSITI